MRKNSYTPVAYSVNELISQDLLNFTYPINLASSPPKKSPKKPIDPKCLGLVLPGAWVSMKPFPKSILPLAPLV